MHILITGAGGFLGQELAAALLAADPAVTLTLTDVVAAPALPKPARRHAARATGVRADLTSPAAVAALLRPARFAACYLLHGVMSGGAEADLELGLRVNLDATRALLDALRRAQPGALVVFASSLAVYGPAPAAASGGPAAAFSEATRPLPQSSYGAQKLAVEVLLDDYSRRGLLDGRALRLPTVMVRPGAPSAAASGFVSGIVRESLRGRRSVLPVRPGLENWVCSPRTVVRNLLRAKDVPAAAFGLSRVVNLPGRVVTVEEILDAVERVGGRAARDLVVEERDERVERIVESWPTRFDVSRARELGFEEDVSLAETVQAYADRLREEQADA